jgi:hypothetical protein
MKENILATSEHMQSARTWSPNSWASLQQLLRLPSGKQVLESMKEVWAWVNSMKNKLYLPLSMVSLMSLANMNTAQAQCCGLDYSMIGVSAWIESTWDDYYANRSNGWTQDGQAIEWKWVWTWGRYRGELSAGTAKHTKWQDSANSYKAYFPRISTAHGISFTDSEAFLVPYAQAQGGMLRTFMSGERAGKAFVYDKANFFVWAQLWLEANIAELFKIGVAANWKMIPSGELDNISWWAIKADHIIAGQVYILYIIP